MKHHKLRGSSASGRDSHEADADASVFFGRASRGRTKQNDHKTRQLCRQVFRTLSHTLSGECGDEVLQSLIVQAVSPAPDAGRLLVDVCFGPTALAVPLHEVLARLEGASGLFRRAVAEAIVRKRAPELIFRLVTPESFEREGIQ